VSDTHDISQGLHRLWDVRYFQKVSNKQGLKCISNNENNHKQGGYLMMLYYVLRLFRLMKCHMTDQVVTYISNFCNAKSAHNGTYWQAAIRQRAACVRAILGPLKAAVLATTRNIKILSDNLQVLWAYETWCSRNSLINAFKTKQLLQALQSKFCYKWARAWPNWWREQ
jgi:hypothetical protein